MNDYTPIIAFCRERIKSLRRIPCDPMVRDVCIDELEAIIRLCGGLHGQNKLVLESIPWLEQALNEGDGTYKP